MARFKAVNGSVVCKLGPTDQPSARREKASRTTAKYTNSDASLRYVISATHNWLTAVSTIYCQVRINEEIVIGIRRDDELSPADRQQIILSPHPLHSRHTDNPAGSPQQFGHLRRTVARMLQRHPLNHPATPSLLGRALSAPTPDKIPPG